MVLAPENSPRQLPENAGAFFLIFRFGQPLSTQIFPRLFFFADAFKSHVHSFVDQVTMHALDF